MKIPELRRVPRDTTLVLAPIAACEPHSHHLATFTDTILVTAVAEGVEHGLAGRALLPPDLVRGDHITNDPPKDDPSLRGLYVADDMKQRTDHGAVGYPELASAEKGRTLLNAAIERTAEVVAALLRRSLPS